MVLFDTPLYALFLSFCNCVTFYCPKFILSINTISQLFSANPSGIGKFSRSFFVLCEKVPYEPLIFIMFSVLFS